MKKSHGVVLIALLTAILLSALGAASASAAECPGTVEGGGVALCSEGHELKGSFAFSGAQKAGTTADVFEPYHRTLPVTISCGLAKLSKGSFVAGTGKLEVSGLYIKYEECRDTADETDCEVSSITVDGSEQGLGTGPGLSSTITGTGSLTLAGGGAKQWWTKYVVKSKTGHTCTGFSEGKIRGTATCSLPESTIEAITHILKCEYGKDTLLNSGSEAGFELTSELKLASGKTWSLQKI